MEVISGAINNDSFPNDFADYADPETGIRRVAGNKAIYLRLMQSFLKDATVEQLVGQIELGDLENAEKTVHSIKGVAGNLSLPKLCQCATDLELDLKKGNIEKADVGEFVSVYERTLEYIKLLVQE
jgi:HPt (histidine-containing phosphotransfer) domain-containing protein